MKQEESRSKRVKRLVQVLTEPYQQANFLPTSSVQAEVTNFEFELLPQGSETLRERLEAHHGSKSNAWNADLFDWPRIDYLNSLGPKAVYYGNKGFKGYAAFQFAGSAKTILESPKIRNATYVFGADWRDLVHLSKTELLTEHKSLCSRIVHGSKWEMLVKKAISVRRR